MESDDKPVTRRELREEMRAQSENLATLISSVGNRIDKRFAHLEDRFDSFEARQGHP